MAKNQLKVCVVITVLNEQETLPLLISALQTQTFLPHQIVIIDGGSTDSTWPILLSARKNWPKLAIFQKPGNRSIGRNFGVSKTNSSIIAFTDAGCIPQPDWLEELITPFSDPKVEVVSGYYQGKYSNIFQKCLIPYVLVMPDRVNHDEFYPSTRSMALNRKIWIKSGGFDPRLSHNEDYAFACWLKKLNIKFTFAPKAIVLWLPRKNLKSAAWMFCRFAIGDIQAGIIRPKVKYLFIRYLIFVFLVFYFLQLKLLLPIYLMSLTYIFWSIAKNYRYINHPAALFWLPVLQITADFCVMFGSLVGWLAKAYGVL